MTEDQQIMIKHFVREIIKAIPEGGSPVIEALNNLGRWFDLELEYEYQRGVEDERNGPGLIVDPTGELKDL